MRYVIPAGTPLCIEDLLQDCTALILVRAEMEVSSRFTDEARFIYCALRHVNHRYSSTHEEDTTVWEWFDGIGPTRLVAWLPQSDTDVSRSHPVLIFSSVADAVVTKLRWSTAFESTCDLLGDWPPSESTTA